MKYALWFGWIAASGCGNKDDGVDPVDTTAPTETTDDPTSYTTLSGTVNYEVRRDGAVDCSSVIELTGTPYEEPCPSCLFAFYITSEVTGDCPFYLAYTWTDSAIYTSPVLAFSLAHDDFVPYSDHLEDVLWYGYEYGDAYDYLGHEDIRFWIPVADSVAEDTPYATNTAPVWDGSTLNWSNVQRQVLLESNPLSGTFCYDEYTVLTPRDAPVAGGAVQESIGEGYGGMTFDVFEFDADAGASVALSVDTVGVDTAFLPSLWILDDAGCVLGTANRSFECSFGDPDANRPTLCPSATFDVPATGQYRAVVSGFYLSDGVVTDRSYRFDIDVEGGATLVEDDAPPIVGPSEVVTTATLDVVVGQ